MKEARERIKMSQQTLASEVGVSVAAICRYETGQRTPSVRVAKQIGEILNVPWFEIMDNSKGDGNDTIPDHPAGG